MQERKPIKFSGLIECLSTYCYKLKAKQQFVCGSTPGRVAIIVRIILSALKLSDIWAGRENYRNVIMDSREPQRDPDPADSAADAMAAVALIALFVVTVTFWVAGQ